MKNFREGDRIIWTEDPRAPTGMMLHGAIMGQGTADPKGKNPRKGYIVQLDREPNPRFINEKALIPESQAQARKVYEEAEDQARKVYEEALVQAGKTYLEAMSLNKKGGKGDKKRYLRCLR